MALSEAKLQELAQIEPPRYLERIADFLSDLTLRSSALAVFEQQQHREPIGSVGLASQRFGQSITAHSGGLRPQRSLDWLYSMLRPYQVGPYELREFTMWLVKWHTKLTETEVIRDNLVSQALAATGAPVARHELREIEETLVVEERRRTRILTRAASTGATVLASGATATSTVVEEIDYLPPGRRRVQVVRRRAVGPTDQPTVEIVEIEPASRTGSAPSPSAIGPSGRAAALPTREPDVMTRAWRAGHTARPAGSGVAGPVEAGVAPETALAPSSARRIASRALWTSNLAMAGAAAGFIYGRSGAPLSLAAQIAAPATYGMAGPAMLTQLSVPSFGYPLSHPPVSTASWLGAAPSAPVPADYAAMRAAPLPMPELAAMPSPHEMPTMPGPSPATGWMAVRPGPTAVGAHRQAMQEAFAPPGEPAPVAVIMPDGTVRQVPSHPSTAPSRRPLPIPGLLAAGLAGVLLARLLSRGPSGGTPLPGVTVQPIPSTARTQFARITARGLPGSVLGTLVVPKAGTVPFADAAALVGAGLPVIGSGPGIAPAPPRPGGPLPASRDLLAPLPSPRQTLAAIGAQTGGPLGPTAGIDQRMGEVTVVAPPMVVASAQSERKGAAVAFDWPVLARGAGELDATGLARLREALPQGAQAIYPALPKGSLPPGAINLRLAPSLLKPLLTQAYGSQAAGIAGSAASTASAASSLVPANMPALGRLVPAGRPAGGVAGVIEEQPGAPASPFGAGALAQAGAGQARRTPMLDFLGLPVRLAPSLGGRAELRDELTARGAAEPGGAPQVVRPNVFSPLRQRLFPGLQTVHAEPDKPAWRRAAPHFGMRDAEPTTVLSPDSRLRGLSASSPLPQGVRPVGLGARSGDLAWRGAQAPGDTPGLAAPGMGRFPSVGASPMHSFQTHDPAGISALEGRTVDLPSTEGAWGHSQDQRADDRRPRPPRAFRAPFSTTEFAQPSADGPAVSGEFEPPTGLWRHGDGGGAPSILRSGLRAPRSRPTMSPWDRSVRFAVDRPDLPASWHGASPDRSGAATGDLGSVPLLQSPAIGSLMGSAPALHSDALRLPPRGLTAPSPASLFSGIAGILSPPARQAEPLHRQPGWSPGRVALPAPPRDLPTTGPSLQSGIGDRLGLAALRSATMPPAALQTVVQAPPQAVAMPMMVPAPMPILARVGGGVDATPSGRARSGAVMPAPAAAGPTPGPLALTMPMMPLPYGATDSYGAEPVGLPAPLFAGMPAPIGSPSLSLPSALSAPAWTPPARTSSTLVQRAPARLYAGVDSGPASRNLMVQRSAGMGHGAAGGPHMPRPSAHRAERITADTQRASVLAAREDGMTANEVHLLANDVWSILRRRLALEADRRGRW